MRGIKFKNYYQLFINLQNRNTEGYTTSEYRSMIFKMIAEDLNKNFLNGHIYADNIQQMQRNDYLAYLKIEYYPTCNNKAEYLYINFLHDCVVFNGLYIAYWGYKTVIL